MKNESMSFSNIFWSFSFQFLYQQNSYIFSLKCIIHCNTSNSCDNLGRQYVSLQDVTAPQWIFQIQLACLSNASSIPAKIIKCQNTSVTVLIKIYLLILTTGNIPSKISTRPQSKQGSSNWQCEHRIFKQMGVQCY